MRLRRARQILKCLGDDNRLRIVNLLKHKELNVGMLCKVLGATQSNISKHLARLRLTGLVSDRRKGFNVYYYLRRPEDKTHKELLNAATKGLSGVDVFKSDARRLDYIEKKQARHKKER